MAAVSTATQLETIQVTGNQVVQLPGVSWPTYKQLDDERGEQSGTRFTFSEGVLQIMALGPDHERLSYSLVRIVDTLSENLMPDFEALGSTTMRREDLEKGFEPDSCFYFTNVAEIRAIKKMNLEVNPPPDLIVEVDITNSSLNRLPLFAAVGVPEVWRCENGIIKIYQLHGELYDEATHSRWFPMVSDTKVGEWLAASWRLPRPEWLRMIRDEIKAI